MPRIRVKEIGQDFIFTDPTTLGSTSLTGDDDNRQWRRISQVKTDIPPFIHERMQIISKWLAETNPFAVRYIKLVKDYTVGEGVTITAHDKDIDNLLSTFWQRNNMDHRITQFAAELAIFGEQLFAIYLDPDSIIRLQYISPLNIKEALRDETDPSIITTIILRDNVRYDIKLDAGGKLIPKPKIDIIRLQKTKKAGYKLRGEGFFFAINKIEDAGRGISDIFPIADWVGVYDDFLFNRADRSAYLNNWYYDITIKNASPQQVQQMQTDLQQTSHKPGMYRIHSDTVTWKVATPELGGEDAAAESGMFLSHIWTALGIPLHWTSQVSTAGRATAVEASDPVYKFMIGRQRIIKQFISQILQFQIDQAIIMGTLADSNIDTYFKIDMPRIAMRDLQRTAGAINRLAAGIATMTKDNIITKEEARSFFLDVMSQVGFDTDKKHIIADKGEIDEEEV